MLFPSNNEYGLQSSVRSNEVAGPVGAAGHWVSLRRHANSEELAKKARSYIQTMLSLDDNRNPRR